jgi:hypothetical protein
VVILSQVLMTILDVYIKLVLNLPSNLECI